MVLSTGDIREDYEIINLVFAHGASTAEGCFGSCNPTEAYEKVSQHLSHNAAGMGANAVVNIRFDFRVAQDHRNKQTFEVFAYGTAVKVEV